MCVCMYMAIQHRLPTADRGCAVLPNSVPKIVLLGVSMLCLYVTPNADLKMCCQAGRARILQIFCGRPI